MPGPIARAYVDIIARLKSEVGSDADKAVRQMVGKIEGQLEALENKGTEAANRLIKDFKRVRIQLNARDAIRTLDRVEDAAQEAVSGLRGLSRLKVGSFDTKAAQQGIDRLQDRVKALSKAVKKTDDDKLSLNVTEARAQLRAIEKAVTQFQTKIEDANRSGINIRTTAATQTSLRQLDSLITDALGALEGIDRQTIKVGVNDGELDAMLRKLQKIDKTIPITLKVKDGGGLRDTENAVTRMSTQAANFQKAFGTAFRRILAFGAIRGAIQGVSTLFREGVRAAGAIQTVEVTLNRFFAQTRDLGQTSGQFFNNLRKLALETPFEFEGLADTSRRILAMGVDADETVEIMTDLTDAVAAVGGGQGEIDGVVRALSQLRSKGRVDLQDFRQISENLPSLSRQLQIKGIIDELNDLHPELNATVADFTRLRTTGQITGQVLTDGVLRAIKEIPGVAGAARAASRTLEGALSNLADFARQEFAQAFGGLGGIIADELNEAFGSMTQNEALTPLASAIRQVIEAFAGAGESALPEILQGGIDLAPGVSDLATAIGELATDALPLLTNISSGALGSLTGLTTVINGLVGALGLLPDGLQQSIGGFGTLALVLPGVSEALSAPLAIMFNTARGAELAAKGITAMNAALKASIVAVAVIALQALLGEFAKATQRSREFNESINEGARSLKEFDDIGDAALDFVNKFRVAGEGVNIGNLEKFLDGLTSGEIEAALGTTSEGLAEVVENISRLGGGFELSEAQIADALKGTGVSMEQFMAAGDDVKANVLALGDQFAAAAERQLDAAISSQKFAFVTDEVAESVKTAAENTGDYVGGLERIKAANQRGARAAIEDAKARGATNDMIDEAIEANTTFVEGVDGSTEAEINYVGALQDVNEALQQQSDVFDGLSQSHAGFRRQFDGLVAATGSADLGGLFVDFAQGVQAAGFEVDELNAIANNLGTTLGRAFSGEELGKVVEHFLGLADGFREGLKGIVPGIEDIQVAADMFSLNSFIEELQRIASARAEMVSNINLLLDEFGELGSQFLDTLISSGLDSTMVAIAIEDALEGGAPKIQEAVDTYGAATSGALDKLAERLAARRFSQEEINEILGVDAFSNGADAVDATLTGLGDDVEAFLHRIDGLNRAIDAAPSPGVARLLEEERAFALGTGPAGAPAVPGIDTGAAVAEAEDAGEQIGAALASSTQASVSEAFVAIDAEFLASVTGLGTEAAEAARGAGERVGRNVKIGLNKQLLTMDDSVTRSVRRLGRQTSSSAKASGEEAGEAFVNGLKAETNMRVGLLLNSIIGQMDNFKRSSAGIMEMAGDGAARAFEGGFAYISFATLSQLRRSATQMLAYDVVFLGRGWSLGRHATEGFEDGLDLSSAVGRALDAFDSAGLRDLTFASGLALGASLGQGIAAGVNATVFLAIAAVVRLVSETFNAAKQTAQVASPSKLFAGLGRQLGQGLADGLLSTLPDLRRVASQMTYGVAGASLGGFAPSGSLSGVPLSAASPAAASPAPAGVVGGARSYANSFTIVAPTDDPETLAMQVAARLEQRLQ